MQSPPHRHAWICFFVVVFLRGGDEALTQAVSRLPLQTLAVREGDDIGGGVHAAPRAAAPHALHGLAGAVGTGGVQRARLLAGEAGALIGVSCRGTKSGGVFIS